MNRISVIDSHTGGEPTRVVIAGGPDLGRGSARRARAASSARRFDTFRSCVVNEPRGSDVLVGALLCEPHDPSCAAGVIFFNNVGILGMCGHGTIGLAVTLAHTGQASRRANTGIETPRRRRDRDATRRAPRHGAERAELPARARTCRSRSMGFGRVTGDIAWGGNWFFLVKDHREELHVSNVERLTDVTWRIRQAVNANGFPARTAARSITSSCSARRSTRRTTAGTSCSAPARPTTARRAAPARARSSRASFADGKLKPGDVWRQESITGSVFEGTRRSRPTSRAW